MDKIMKAIQELLKATVANSSSPLNDVKKVFYWDPQVIPESDLPALTIAPVSSDYDPRGSRYDEKTHEIEIRLVYNAKSVFGVDSEDKLTSQEEIIAKMEWTANQETSVLTVCWTIQANPMLPYDDSWTLCLASSLALVSNVSYWAKNSRAFPTYEAVATVSAKAIGNRT